MAKDELSPAFKALYSASLLVVEKYSTSRHIQSRNHQGSVGLYKHHLILFLMPYQNRAPNVSSKLYKFSPSWGVSSCPYWGVVPSCPPTSWLSMVYSTKKSTSTCALIVIRGLYAISNYLSSIAHLASLRVMQYVSQLLVRQDFNLICLEVRS